MNRLLPVICLLFLAGCTANASAPRYVVNTPKVIAINTELRDCMQQAIDTKYYGLDRTRTEIQTCVETSFHKLQFKKNPESFYVYSMKENAREPLDEFVGCSFGLADPMWDFGPDDTTYTFRAQVQKCINSFPKQ